MNNIGRYCDYRGCYNEIADYMMEQQGEFFISLYACEKHKEELANIFRKKKTVWIVAWDEGYLGGYGYDLRHICATEELAKKKLNEILLTMYDEIPEYDTGWFIEEKEIETV